MALGPIARGIPRTITPHVNGKAYPAEHLAYLNDHEARLLRAMTDGHSNKTPWGPQSFVDPSGAYGGDMSGTQTVSNYNGSGSQPNSYGGYSGGYGNYGNYGAATGGGIGSSSNDSGSRFGSGQGGNSSDSAASRDSGGQHFSFTPDTGSGRGGGGNSGSNYTQPASGRSNGTGFGTPNYVTAASVPAIPNNGGGATYTPEAHRVMNTTVSATASPAMTYSAPDYSAPASMVALPAGFDPTKPAPQANDAETSQPAKDTSTAADDYGASDKVAWVDPRAGYYDQNGVNAQTQFADRLREELQLHGVQPNDSGIAAVMGNLSNEKLGPYLSNDSNAWVIGSPANRGQFPQIGANPDSGGTTAWGAPQWNSGAGRLQMAQDFFAQNGLNPNDPNAQAQGVAADIAGQMPGQTGDYRNLFAGMQGMAPAQAAATWMRGYENPSYNPAVNNVAGRQASANQFAANIPQGSMPETQMAWNGGDMVAQPASYQDAPQVGQNTAPQGFGAIAAPASQMDAANAQVADGGLYGAGDPTTNGNLSPGQTENVPAELAMNVKNPNARAALMKAFTGKNDPQTLASLDGITNGISSIGLGRGGGLGPIAAGTADTNPNLTATQKNVLQMELQYASPERKAEIMQILAGKLPYGMNFGVSYQAV